MFLPRAFFQLSESYIYSRSGSLTGLKRPQKTLLAHSKIPHPLMERRIAAQTERYVTAPLHHNGQFTSPLFRITSFPLIFIMFATYKPIAPLARYMLGQNANVLLFSVRKHKLDLNVIINCQPQWHSYGEGMAVHKEPQCTMGQRYLTITAGGGTRFLL